VEDWIELTKALVPLAWPLILGIVLWRLFPAIRGIMNSQSFSVKLFGAEVSVQNATEQLSSRIEDLQKQVVALKEGHRSNAIERLDESDSVAASDFSRSVLWVDDKPTNNSFEIAQLANWGVFVATATSTKEAMEILQQDRDIAVVVSDMGRREGGVYRSQAGLVLLRAMRRAGFETPLFVYSSAKYAAQNRHLVMAEGGSGATSSQIEMLEWLREKLGLTRE
jgi:CheY-like chemotaxis protein